MIEVKALLIKYIKIMSPWHQVKDPPLDLIYNLNYFLKALSPNSYSEYGFNMNLKGKQFPPKHFPKIYNNLSVKKDQTNPSCL